MKVNRNPKETGREAEVSRIFLQKNRENVAYICEDTEIDTYVNKFIFVTEFLILCKNPHFYEVNQWVLKWLRAWGDFKKLLCCKDNYGK